MSFVSAREHTRFANPLRSQRALRAHRFLIRAAFAGAHVFAWIFVFQYFYILSLDPARALARVALLYALSQTITCLLTPYAAQALRKGARRALMYAILSAASAFIILGATFEGLGGGAVIAAGITVFAILLGLYRALYFVPYEVEARDLPRARRLQVIFELLIALLPACAGLLVVTFGMGPVWLLFGAGGVVAVSLIPLIYVRDQYEQFSWGYRETFVHLIARENRGMLRKSVYEGVSGAAFLLVWPIAAFQIVGWSYAVLGIVLSMTFLAAILVRGPLRALVRRARLHESKLLNATFVVSPWILRLAVATPLGIALADSYFYTTAPARQGIDPFVFEQVSDGGSFVDEYTALKEMGLSIGRIILCASTAALALFVSLPLAFVGVFLFAALASFALVVLAA